MTAVRHGRYQMVFKNDMFAVIDGDGVIVKDDDGQKISGRIKMHVDLGGCTYDWKRDDKFYWKGEL